jgi:hypothetical protein
MKPSAEEDPTISAQSCSPTSSAEKEESPLGFPECTPPLLPESIGKQKSAAFSPPHERFVASAFLTGNGNRKHVKKTSMKRYDRFSADPVLIAVIRLDDARAANRQLQAAGTFTSSCMLGGALVSRSLNLLGGVTDKYCPKT